MSSLFPIVGTVALLGSALIGGVFFAFSSFVMKALARMPCSEGIRAMQSINVAVINPWFLGAFIGTTLISIGFAVLTITSASHATSLLILGGVFCYFAGTFLVTLLGNVPLNDRLAALSAAEPAAEKLWEHYLDQWTMWNHIRTAAALLAALMYVLGLIRMSTG